MLVEQSGAIMTATVAALYITSKSIYKEMGLDCYDIERDARTYTGDLPIVAHPVCAPWSKLKGFCKMPPEAKDCAWHALEQVRRCGGVLEHPVGSSFFKEAGIPLPDASDGYGVFGPWCPYGGAVMKVKQWDYAHRGIKDTYLYIYGTLALPVLWERMDESTPIKVQNMCQRERLETPPGMAHWLVRAGICLALRSRLSPEKACARSIASAAGLSLRSE